MGNKLEQLKNLLTYKKSKKFYAEKLQVTLEELNELMWEYRKTKDTLNSANNYIADLEEAYVKVNQEKGTLESTITSDFSPKDHKELAKLHKIDLTKYQISNYWTKQRGEKFTSSVLCTLIKDENVTTENLSSILLNYQSPYEKIKKSDILINETFGRPNLAFISLTDAHISKFTIDYTSAKQKADTYLEVLKNLLYQAYRTHYIDEILFVIGSDFSHIDNTQFGGSTENGTPQQSTLTWYDAYEIEFDTQVKAIHQLRQFCNKLIVKHIPGNHARTKEYFMAHALEVYFNQDNNIIFDRTSDCTKFYVYGNTFLGFHHGDTVTEKLPLYFASKYRKEWGNAKYSEIALGDRHHRKEWKFSLNGLEAQGTRMFICPSLSKVDQWHKNKLFDQSISAGICRIYDKETGYTTEFEKRI